MDNHILQIRDLEGLIRLHPQIVDLDEFTDECLDHVFRLCGALWKYSGDPKKPHVEISGGFCSDGFVNLRRVLCHPKLCEIMAMVTVDRLRRNREFGPLRVNWVVGSDHTSATFSYEVAKHLGAKHQFTERGPDGSQLWRLDTIGPQEIVLQVEALISTARTVKAVRHGLRIGNAHPINFFPAILTLASRSKEHMIDDIYPIISVRHYEMDSWTRDDCPLHKEGSVSIHKPEHHWHMLTGNL